MYCFRAYGQILEGYYVYFIKRIKSHFYHVLKMQNGYRHRFMTIH
jgi:hypothetical protein